MSSLACGNPSHDDKPPRNRAPQNEAAQIGDGGPSKIGGQSLKMGAHPPQNEQDLRSYKKIKKIKEAATAQVVLASEVMQSRDIPLDGEATEEILMSFEAELPTAEQSKFISAFMEQEYPHGFFPPTQVIRMLAAAEWYQTRYSAQSIFASAARAQ